MNRKIIAWLFFVVLLVVIYAGCAGKGSRPNTLGRVIDDYFIGQKVSVEIGSPDCPVRFIITSSSRYSICEVGDDYVKICEQGSSKTVIYPIERMCIVTE